MDDNDQELKVTIFKLLGTKHRAKVYRELLQLSAILLMLGFIIGVIGYMQWFVARLGQ